MASLTVTTSPARKGLVGRNVKLFWFAESVKVPACGPLALPITRTVAALSVTCLTGCTKSTRIAVAPGAIVWRAGLVD